MWPGGISSLMIKMVDLCWACCFDLLVGICSAALEREGEHGSLLLVWRLSSQGRLYQNRVSEQQNKSYLCAKVNQ